MKKTMIFAAIAAILGSVMPAGAVIYVKPNGANTNTGADWSKAKATIQAGIDAAYAKGGDKVFVMTGVYSGGITLKSGVTLRGGYSGTLTTRDTTAYPTVIDAAGAKTAVKVTSQNWVTIDGFGIYNGYAQNGGGINCSSSTLTVANCAFNNNYAVRSGGAIYATYSTLTVTGCTFAGNSAVVYGGAVHSASGNLTATDCTFTGNSARYGGALDIYDVTVSKLLRDVISENSADYGGGVSARWASNFPVLNCIISGNAAYCGGGIYYSHCTTLQASNLIEGNTATTCGGGVYWCSNSFADSVNDTMVANTANQGGAVCALNWNTGWVANAILYDNRAWQGGAAYKDRNSVLDLYNCCYELNGDSPFYGGVNPTTENHNKQADPLFVDYAAANYHLQAGSPCISAADPWFDRQHTDWKDLDSQPRFIGKLDIGCYEYR